LWIPSVIVKALHCIAHCHNILKYVHCSCILVSFRSMREVLSVYSILTSHIAKLYPCDVSASGERWTPINLDVVFFPSRHGSVMTVLLHMRSVVFQ